MQAHRALEHQVLEYHRVCGHQRQAHLWWYQHRLPSNAGLVGSTPHLVGRQRESEQADLGQRACAAPPKGRLLWRLLSPITFGPSKNC
jgi:hypothetical protein